MKALGFWIGLIVFLTGVVASSPVGGEAYDVWIQGGWIVDGTGSPRFRGDLAIRGDRIVAIGRVIPPGKAKQVINAQGKIVCPGFIDMLGQSGYTLLTDGSALSKITQGITTEITGEGGSVAPRLPRTQGEKRPADPEWTDFKGYFQQLKKQGIAMNIASFVGAGLLRRLVIGEANRPPTPEELERMKALVRQAMEQGAFGLSSALEYAPGSYANTEELIELAKVAAEYGGLYATHVRNEGNGLFSSLEEAIRIGKEAKIPVEIFHLKIAGKPNWGKMKEVVRKIRQAQEQGVEIAGNLYPYTAAGTGLGACLPPWVYEGGRESFVKRLEDPGIRKRIRKEIETSLEREDDPSVVLPKEKEGQVTLWENLYQECGGGSGILITSLADPGLDRRFSGKYLSEVAQLWGKDEIETLLDLVKAGGGSAIFFAMAEEDLITALQEPWTSFCTDASATSIPQRLRHPRVYGTFPRVLSRYVREKKILSWEEAIRKMTALPACRLGLTDRGVLKKGLKADIVIFDPLEIQDKATFTDSAHFSEGVEYVFVNGVAVLAQGRPTGARPGKPLIHLPPHSFH